MDQAVILAGGLGTRLGPLTRETPKPLLPVAGVPFVEHIIRHVARFGFRDVVLLVGYRAEQFEPLAAPGRFEGVSVRLSVEPPALLGTGGALAHAGPMLAGTFLLLNGDTLFDVNLLDLTAPFATSDAVARIALRRQPAAGRYGAVALDGPRVTAFGGAGTLINAGVYAVRRSILDAIGREPCSIERDVFPGLAGAGRLEGAIYDGAFLDIGMPQDLAQAEAFIRALRRRPAVFLDRDGVLNHDTGYLHRVEDLVWRDGAQAAVKRLNDAGYYVFVVTNQSGVARGYYGCADVEALHCHMQAELRTVGAHVDAFEYCPFHPEGVVAAFRGASRRRKPAPGMIEDLLASWPVTRERSLLIGDQATDLAAAEAAGIRGFHFVGGNLAEFVARLLGGEATNSVPTGKLRTQ